MPNYPAYPSYNASPMYPANSYQQQYSQAASPAYPQPQMGYQQPAAMNGICWVDGEVGAKAQPLPVGWDTSKPFPMWDTNDQLIYLKSFNQMGMPNPLTKLRYTIEENTRQAPMMNSRAALPSAEEQHANGPDMSDYVRKDDLQRMADELKAAISAGNAEQKGAKNNAKSSV